MHRDSPLSKIRLKAASLLQNVDEQYWVPNWTGLPTLSPIDHQRTVGA